MKEGRRVQWVSWSHSGCKMMNRLLWLEGITEMRAAPPWIGEEKPRFGIAPPAQVKDLRLNLTPSVTAAGSPFYQTLPCGTESQLFPPGSITSATLILSLPSNNDIFIWGKFQGFPNLFAPRRTKTQGGKLADGIWWRERTSGLISHVSQVRRPWYGKDGVSDYFGSREMHFLSFKLTMFLKCFYFNLKHTHTHTQDLELLPSAKGESQWECINSQNVLPEMPWSPYSNCKIYFTALFLCMDQKMKTRWWWS